jgi:hypothetical protein
VRFRDSACPTCGPSSFNAGYSDFVPEPYAFTNDACGQDACQVHTNGRAPADTDLETLVQVITERVMATLNGAGV